MRLVNTRTSGWSPDDQLVQFFSLLQQRPQEKIYVHCWLGDDRTGVFLAAYRMAFERWTPQRALQEMYFFHGRMPEALASVCAFSSLRTIRSVTFSVAGPGHALFFGATLR